MSKQLKVLLVEDSEYDAELLLFELKCEGFEVAHQRVETAESMRKALEKEKWDIIIADYNLPQFSAVAALNLMKDKGLDLPFIIVSGSMNEETAVKCMQMGAHDYLSKGNWMRLVPVIEREIREAEIRLSYKLAKDHIQKQLERMRALHTIDQTINSSLNLKFTLDILITQVTMQLGVDTAAILLYNAKTQLLEYAVGKGFKSAALQHTHLRMGQGYAGRAALNRQTLHIADLRGNKGEFVKSPLFEKEEFIVYYGVPLIAKGQIKGVLEIFHRKPLNPDYDWLEFMGSLASQAALAIDNSSLFEELERTNLQWAIAYDATIKGWAHALDLREKGNQGHTQRVTEMTLKLARQFGIKDESMIHVQRGALLHDIGKIAVPDHILQKPGPLTEEEWAIMKLHPTYAHELLYPIEYLRPADEIPYCHHERWNGSGYPRGLKEQDIPLSARIFSVTDVWDSLLTTKPYRAAWEPSKVKDYLLSNRNILFDPSVVDAFMEMKPSHS